MIEEGILEIISQTPIKERMKRFEYINSVFMEKYFQLVWLARSNKRKFLKEEVYEALKAIKEIEEKYPEEVKALDECDSNWQHGFNSGILAYSRFLSTYIKDDLWLIEDTGVDEEEWEEKDIKIIDGKKYVLMDGKENAFNLFPELDT